MGLYILMSVNPMLLHTRDWFEAWIWLADATRIGRIILITSNWKMIVTVIEHIRTGS